MDLVSVSDGRSREEFLDAVADAVRAEMALPEPPRMLAESLAAPRDPL